MALAAWRQWGSQPDCLCLPPQAFSAFTNDVIWLIVVSFFFARVSGPALGCMSALKVCCGLQVRTGWVARLNWMGCKSALGYKSALGCRSMRHQTARRQTSKATADAAVAMPVCHRCRCCAAAAVAAVCAGVAEHSPGLRPCALGTSC